MTAPTAYFSMEIMLETDIPSYAGGLGILAGDLLRSAADLSIPIVGVSLVYSGRTFSQTINPDGSQSFQETDWQRLDQLTHLPHQVTVTLAGNEVTVGCWRYDIVGLGGFIVPVFLLDTNLPQNPPWIRQITKNLYQANADVRISQEVVLGIGGVLILQKLGFAQIKTYHLNEGHCAFVSLALMPENHYQDAAVRQKCVFTTHTPVPEGHDTFSYEHASYWAGTYLPWHIKNLASPNSFSLTELALNLSHASFAVSQKHLQTCQALFPTHKFGHVTNGVHHRSWTWYILQTLFDKYLPGWLDDPALLSQAPAKIPDDALWAAHQEAKTELVEYVNRHLSDHLGRSGDELFNTDTLTISMARRPVAYKRPLLLYHDLERFIRLGVGKIQIIQSGKSHPADDVSQSIVKQIIKISQKLKTVLRIAYLENYSPKIARLMVAGSDIWLNTPTRPLEASGTSGMKAALNGVLNFSVLDGWWIEGQKLHPDAGFTIGNTTSANDDATDADALYTKLESEIIPEYYHRRSWWIRRMKSAIALGSYFNTHRAVSEYLQKAWTN